MVCTEPARSLSFQKLHHLHFNVAYDLAWVTTSLQPLQYSLRLYAGYDDFGLFSKHHSACDGTMSPSCYEKQSL
jgi:hypothetical protein